MRDKGISMSRNREILELAVLAGKILLENGAEISRVQGTIIRIIESFGISDYNVYVLSNGIFATVDEKGEHPSVSVRDLPMGTMHLGRIAAVNALSREIADKGADCDIADLRKRLTDCGSLPPTSQWLRLAACFFSAGTFCYLMGGSVSDSFAAALAGAALHCFLFFGHRMRLNKFMIHILGSAWVTLCSRIILLAGLGVSLNNIVSGAIIPLVPGVVLTTAIRDYFNSDHISGVIHLAEALLTAACIAVGVGAMLQLLSWLQGVIR